MTEPDIIRIDGVEYEACKDCPGDKCADPQYVCIRPKRKQTGWVCRECGESEPCLSIGRVQPVADACAIRDSPDWQPFYGKVVE
jgi:hypothetical protein